MPQEHMSGSRWVQKGEGKEGLENCLVPPSLHSTHFWATVLILFLKTDFSLLLSILIHGEKMNIVQYQVQGK